VEPYPARGVMTGSTSLDSIVLTCWGRSISDEPGRCPSGVSRRGAPGCRAVGEQHARDPVIGERTAKLRDGSLTDEGRREWVAYARKKDLSRGLGDQRVFRTRHPGEGSDMIVEFKRKGENRIDVLIFTR
jgi:hypothetical protein